MNQNQTGAYIGGGLLQVVDQGRHLGRVFINARARTNRAQAVDDDHGSGVSFDVSQELIQLVGT